MDLRQDAIVHEDLDFGDTNVLKRLPYALRRSPIMITLADPKFASQDIQKMIELGVNIAKFETSHYTVGERIKLLGKLENAVEFLTKKYAVPYWPVTTCMELKTCIARTGFLDSGDRYVILKEGQPLVLIYDVTLFDKCTAHKIFVDNPFIAVELKVGMDVSIDQDEVVLRCTKIIDDKSVECVVTKSGKLTDMCIVVIRGGARTASPLITSKDLEIINFALEYQMDMLIMNYSRRPESIKIVKEFIGKKSNRPILLAGICTPEGLNNVDAIIKEADGIVFSREFLAFTLEKGAGFRLMHAQKLVGAKCLQAGKPFFISGEVFRRAIETGEFHDNETADITNAILDGATGFIIKESNNLDTTLEVINAMNELSRFVEPLTNSKTAFWRVLEGVPVNAAEASAISCAAASHQTKARIIIIPTVTGYTAKTLLWLRPASLVLSVSTRKSTTRRLQSYRCVVPLLFPGGHFKNWYKTVEARVEFAVEYAVKRGWLKLGDSYVTLQRGSEDSAFCDMVRIWQVTISEKTLVECPDDTIKGISTAAVSQKTRKSTLPEPKKQTKDQKEDV